MSSGVVDLSSSTAIITRSRFVQEFRSWRDNERSRVVQEPYTRNRRKKNRSPTNDCHTVDSVAYEFMLFIINCCAVVSAKRIFRVDEQLREKRRWWTREMCANRDVRSVIIVVYAQVKPMFIGRNQLCRQKKEERKNTNNNNDNTKIKKTQPSVSIRQFNSHGLSLSACYKRVVKKKKNGVRLKKRNCASSRFLRGDYITSVYPDTHTHTHTHSHTLLCSTKRIKQRVHSATVICCT
jgi:hypothetical protein